VSTASATITLDFESMKEWLFYATPSFATAKTIAVSNATNAIRLTLLFEITNTSGTLELPSNFMCVDARMVGQVFTPFDTGRYKMRADFDGTNWWVDEFIGLSSLSSSLSSLEVAVSGGTITLDFEDQPDREFYGDTSFGAARIIALANNTNARRLDFAFKITNVAAALTWPSNFFMKASPQWNTSTKLWT